MRSFLPSTAHPTFFLLLFIVWTFAKKTPSNSDHIPQKFDPKNRLATLLPEIPLDSGLPEPSIFDLTIPVSLMGLSAQVNGCKIYDAISKCLYCTRDQYLSSNVCVSIVYAQTISHCNINLNLTNCYQCDVGYALSSTGTTCVSVGTTNNCASFYAIGICASCVSGSFFSNGQCSAPLANCLTAGSAVNCLACQANYYLTATSTCLPVATLISNCVNYSSTQLCSACAQGYALSTDGLTCLAGTVVSGQIDPNCQQSIISTGTYCNLCRQGYYLSTSNTCVTLNANNESCFIANPVSPAQCLVCMKGYTIQTGNLCVINTQTSQAQVGTNPTAGASWIRGVISVLLVGLLIN